MAEDYGIIISQPGTDVAGAPTNQIILNTTNSFIKIDTQNPVGFQTITLIITNDPPEPSGSSYSYTVLYQFKHGYKYIPSVETLFYVLNKPAFAVLSQEYFQERGVISSRSAFDEAVLYCVTDATYVYFVVAKYNNGGSPNILTGANIQITTHVFVEDVGV